MAAAANLKLDIVQPQTKGFLVEEIEFIKLDKKPMTAVAKSADRTAYNALITDHPDNNILPCS